MTQRFWIRFTQPTEDFRPLTCPPNKHILAWWCSGYDAEDDAILCALVAAKDERAARKAIYKDWPEAERQDVEHVAKGWLPGDRFPITHDWERERLK